MNEQQVMKHFNTYKKGLIAKLGTKATTDKQLTTVGKSLFGSKYIGTFSSDYKPRKTPSKQYFIINVDGEQLPGSHWLGIVKNNNTYYIFDSYGRSAKRLIPNFAGGKHIIETDPDVDQSKTSDICGALCLAWLCTVDKLGIRAALKV